MENPSVITRLLFLLSFKGNYISIEELENLLFGGYSKTDGVDFQLWMRFRAMLKQQLRKLAQMNLISERLVGGRYFYKIEDAGIHYLKYVGDVSHLPL